jgi:hypothetical protein
MFTHHPSNICFWQIFATQFSFLVSIIQRIFALKKWHQTIARFRGIFCSEIAEFWLIPLADDHQLWLHHKIERKKEKKTLPPSYMVGAG